MNYKRVAEAILDQELPQSSCDYSVSSLSFGINKETCSQIKKSIRSMYLSLRYFVINFFPIINTLLVLIILNLSTKRS